MCFSATVSFAAGAVLTTAGVTTMSKITHPSQAMFAAIPMVFGVQQLSEGFVWLGLHQAQYASSLQPATYLFLVFAQVLWPVWVPLSMLLLEKDEKRRKVISVLVTLGIIISMALGFRLLTQVPGVQVYNHHIYYSFGIPITGSAVVGAGYVLCTIFPLFFSSVRRMKVLGTFNLLSFVVTAVFFRDFMVSVWCFFAAAISVVVYFVMRDLSVIEPDHSGKHTRAWIDTERPYNKGPR
jgi:hypothetical protein